MGLGMSTPGQHHEQNEAGGAGGEGWAEQQAGLAEEAGTGTNSAGVGHDDMHVGSGDDGEGDEWAEEMGSPDGEEEKAVFTPIPGRGCQHYSRGCKLVSPCCGQAFWCRFCHNTAFEHDTETAQRHTLDRHAVKLVECYKCGLKQSVSQSCQGEGCGNKFGKYFCAICNFFDDDLSKQPFHCNGCGICRVGGADNFFHCETCGCCYAIQLRNNHKCIQDSMHQNCPVCQENLFNSTFECRVLRCGHTMHRDCLGALMNQTRVPTCPLCSVSIMDSSVAWSQLDQEIAQTPMPAEYANLKVNLLCNDCHTKGEVPLHFIGLKCPNEQVSI